MALTRNHVIALASFSLLGFLGFGSGIASRQESKREIQDSAIRLEGFPMLQPRLSDERHVAQGVEPASCKEAGFSGPPYSKLLGGSCGNRCGNPSFEMVPKNPTVVAGQPMTLFFRPRMIGIGDYVIYTFGKIDWGDTQQQVVPVHNGQAFSLTHTYTTPGQYRINIMGGAQFKYHGRGSCSYECCVDNRMDVAVK